MKRIRQKYAADERPYHAFLQALIKFRNKQFSAEEVVQKCAILFYDQPEVLEGEDGLATFVPKTCHPAEAVVVVRLVPRGAPSFRERQFPIIRAHIVIMRVQESNEPTRTEDASVAPDGWR